MIPAVLIVIGLVLAAAVVHRVWMSRFRARLDDGPAPRGGIVSVPFDARAIAEGAVAVVIAAAVAVDAGSVTRLRGSGT